MSSYLMKYKGKYRLKVPYDIKTKQFTRKLNGTFEDNDMYIEAQKGVKIFHYGKSILEAYIPSLIRGHNIVKAIKNDLGNNVIFHIEETDSEVLFRFHSKYLDKLEPYLKPKTNGAGISPFSSKNLPKSKYNIPDEDLGKYQEIVANIPKNQLINLAHIGKDFMQSLTTKKYTYEDMKADMALKGLKGKEYIHSIGKWEDYIIYLKERL